MSVILTIPSILLKVPNVFPTISAVINVSPERYIWRIGVALASSPCMLEVLIYYSFFKRAATNIIYRGLNFLVALLLTMENLSLIGLTFVSSTENYSNANLISIDSFLSYKLATMIFLNLIVGD